jgi:hypothetical protein
MAARWVFLSFDAVSVSCIDKIINALMQYIHYSAHVCCTLQHACWSSLEAAYI